MFERKNQFHVILLLSFLVALVFCSKHYFGYQVGGEHYSPLAYSDLFVKNQTKERFSYLPEAVIWDETYAYARYVNEILREEWAGATIASYQNYLLNSDELGNKNTWVSGRLGVVVIGFIASYFDNDITTAFVVADFVFPLILAISVFLFSMKIHNSINFGIIVTALFFFFNWQDFLGLLQFQRYPLQDVGAMLYLRTPYPQLSTALFFLFLTTLINLKNRLNIQSAILFIFILILNLYTYFYTWSLAMAVIMGVLMLLCTPVFTLVSPFKPERIKLIVLLSVTTFISILASFPTWLSILFGGQLTNEMFVRHLGTFTHMPNIKYTIMISICIGISFFLKNDHWKMRWLWVSIFIGLLVALNQQVIMGKLLQAAHYTGQLVQPLIIIFFLDILYSIYQNKIRSRIELPNNVKYIPIGFFLICSVFTVGRLSVAAESQVKYTKISDSLVELQAFLRKEEWKDYSFYVQDAYLNLVLPTYIPQKNLNPLYVDPISNLNMLKIRSGIQNAKRNIGFNFDETELDGLKDIVGLKEPLVAFEVKTDQLLFVINRHKKEIKNESICDAVYKNQDFLILKANCI